MKFKFDSILTSVSLHSETNNILFEEGTWVRGTSEHEYPCLYYTIIWMFTVIQQVFWAANVQCFRVGCKASQWVLGAQSERHDHCLLGGSERKVTPTPGKVAMQPGCKMLKIAWESAPAWSSSRFQNYPTCSPTVGFGSRLHSSDLGGSALRSVSKMGLDSAFSPSQWRLRGLWLQESHASHTPRGRYKSVLCYGAGSGEMAHYCTILADGFSQTLGI